MAARISLEAATKLGLVGVEYDHRGKRRAKSPTGSIEAAPAPRHKAPKGRSAKLVHAGGPVWRLDLS